MTHYTRRFFSSVQSVFGGSNKMSQRRKIAIAHSFAVPVVTMEIDGAPLNPALVNLIDIRGQFM
jgi:hypothetical protein